LLVNASFPTGAVGPAGAGFSNARGVRPEIVVLWILFVAVTVEILATYSRLPAAELYHVSGSGLEGGASRALVFLNFPTALVALALLALLYGSLSGRIARATALIAAALSCAVFWPGVVSQADLDARPVNSIAAAGVALTLLLTIVVALRDGLAPASRGRGDWVRGVVAAALVLLSIPWFAADLGFYLDGVPVLDRLFQTRHYAHQLAGAPASLPAVHHGHHHGVDGLLLAMTALLLSRALTRVKAGGLRTVFSLYLALMLCYGVANIANDFWLEQVVKRGWTNWRIPNVLEPRATAAWGIIVLAAGIVWALGSWRGRRTSSAWGRASGQA
jgi:hypothetical protein